MKLSELKSTVESMMGTWPMLEKSPWSMTVKNSVFQKMMEDPEILKTADIRYQGPGIMLKIQGVEVLIDKKRFNPSILVVDRPPNPEMARYPICFYSFYDQEGEVTVLLETVFLGKLHKMQKDLVMAPGSVFDDTVKNKLVMEFESFLKDLGQQEMDKH